MAGSRYIHALILLVLAFTAYAGRIINDDLVVQGKMEVESVTEGSKPCPVMTNAQMNAIVSPEDGDCVYSSTDKKWYTYNGTTTLWEQPTPADLEQRVADLESLPESDVVGPESSNPNRLARYSDSTGKVLKDSQVTVDDSGNISTLGRVDSGNVRINGNSISTTSGQLSISTNLPTDRISMGRPTRFTNSIFYNHVNDPSSGSDVVLSLPSAKNVRLTAEGDLVSISGISMGDTGQEVTLMNQTGSPVIIKDRDVSAGTGQIVTGLEDDIELAPESSITLVYDIVYFRWFVIGGAGGGQLKFQAQNSSTEGKIKKIIAPAKQFTETGDKEALLETGNKNLLANPGFEHQTITSGWTLSCTDDAIGIATPDSSAGRPSHFGKKTLNLEINGMDTGGTCVFYQDVETGGAFDYMHSIWAKADTAGKARVMFRKNALGWVPGEGNELDVSLDWKQYQFQRVSGSTHAGIGIEVAVGIGETVNVSLDEAVVGYNDPVSEQYYCDNIECETTFVAKIAAGTAVSNENYDWIKSVTLSDTSLYTIEIHSGLFSATPFCDPEVTLIGHTEASVLVARIELGTTSSNILVRTGFVNSINNFTKNAYSFEISCTRTGTDFTAAKAKMKRKVVSTGAELFSTDTHTLTFKSTAITSSDPVGTYNTYRFTTNNSNAQALCTSTPLTAPSKADGLKISTRAFSGTSVCDEAVKYKVKIANSGTPLPTLDVQLFKNAGKSTPGSTIPIYNSTLKIGITYLTYDINTGVLTIDAGTDLFGNSTISRFEFEDLSNATSGYLVINAQPAKTTQAMSLKMKNMVGVARYIVKTYNSVNDWYEVHSDCWVRQGGIVSTGAPGATRKFATLHIPYKTKMATANIIGISESVFTSGEANLVIDINNSTSSQLAYFSNSGPTTTYAMWTAEGYGSKTAIQALGVDVSGCE